MTKLKFTNFETKISFKSVIHNNALIQYKIKRSMKYKNITMKHDENYNLIILAPHHINDDYIENFVHRNISSMLAKIEKVRNSHLLDLTQNQIFLLGKRYKLVRLLTNQRTSKILLNNLEAEQIYFYVGTAIGNDLTKQRQYIFQQVKRISAKYLKNRVQFFCQKFSLALPEVQIKILKRKWGWCSSKKIIALNALLIAFEHDVIDHVICHELAHLTHMNHAKPFQQLLRYYDPNTDQVIKKIKFNLD
ncbi:putative metal-dependent hydrolase [Mycoplasmoides fastidiosum]|uniref:Metal-dependent hydrolase n=1 Tax=Mycoplasmoides fastidiosum TaxID=92758 RepID=A0ABU0LZX1_9BACT|nr:YgjP-like metallopeptidase domain-containing protein [Mycoplasmoides fastidiosum]MDQ0514140.1 putative metal-dependent hydrolase [Mycoplasmoides fastidiosum]UUD37452.1 M48 family metallopeptidase [Mycoplasmoides fastidiosum]